MIEYQERQESKATTTIIGGHGNAEYEDNGSLVYSASPDNWDGAPQLLLLRCGLV